MRTARIFVVVGAATIVLAVLDAPLGTQAAAGWATVGAVFLVGGRILKAVKEK